VSLKGSQLSGASAVICVASRINGGFCIFNSFEFAVQGFYVINGYRFQKMFWFVAVESALPLIDKLLLYVTVELEVMGLRSA
jgi:hypothetical protein